jgi:hypothetical protein
VKWDIKDIVEVLGGGLLASVLAWLRFGRKDKAEVGKLKSETVLDLAKVLEKRIAEDNATMGLVLQMNVNAVSQAEKLRAENDRLYENIATIKLNFEAELQNELQKISEKHDKKVSEIKKECERTNRRLLAEIKRLNDQLNIN